MKKQKRSVKKDSALYSDELTQQDRFNCSTYALNCLSGPRMVQHFAAFWEEVSKDLQHFAEEKAIKILAKRRGK